MRKGSTLQGCSIYGSVMEPEYRHAPFLFFEMNLGTTILFVDDGLGLSKVLWDHCVPSFEVSLEDSPKRYEIISRINDGSVMGMVVGLRGPRQSVWDQQKEKRKGKQTQASSLVRCQQYHLELASALDARKGFVILCGSARNKAWEHMVIRNLLNSFSWCFNTFVLHSCMLGGSKRWCTTLRIATTFQIDTTVSAAHSPTCPGTAKTRSQRHTSQRYTRMCGSAQKSGEESADADDVEAGLNDFSRALVSKVFLPTMQATLSNRMSRAERYPTTGPNEPIVKMLSIGPMRRLTRSKLSL